MGEHAILSSKVKTRQEQSEKYNGTMRFENTHNIQVKAQRMQCNRSDSERLYSELRKQTLSYLKHRSENYNAYNACTQASRTGGEQQNNVQNYGTLVVEET